VSEVDILVDVSSALASGNAERLEYMLEIAAREVETSLVDEALLQSYLFLGYPAALRAFGVWRRISGGAGPEAPQIDDEVWPERGRATFGRVYGAQAERLLENARALHPDLARWMVTEGYGKVLSREALPLPARELCIVALLVWQDAAPQLYSHLRGALNAGVPEAQVDATVQRLAAELQGTRRETLRQQWQEVRARRAGNE